MTSVFDVVTDGAEYFLRELEDDLKEILHSIAHDDKYEDKKYIALARKYMKRKYGKTLEDMRESKVIDSLGMPADWIVRAYYGLFELGIDYRTPESIRHEADDILGEFLEIPDPADLDPETRYEILKEWEWTDEMIKEIFGLTPTT